eukprot:TRINITY_DN37601_c0_g2_i1.p1 TRINITY_DN37601_c0_g2~~TRINITY_DN37601_c0_g2_i1.p1  ORF type:complete len:1120 (+),score=336.52 TRINITY_DN37601_c0_g2_i1:147-3506(+)
MTAGYNSPNRLAAPFFSTRVGISVVTHGGSPDNRHVRSPWRLRSDTRARFKDSYGVASPSARKLGFQSPRDGEQVDGLQATPLCREAQLELELAEARAEVQQLRFALRASANALHQASALLPPDAEKDILSQRQLMEEMTKELTSKDDEIIQLQKAVSGFEHKAMQSSKSVKVAVDRFIGQVDRVQLQEIWVHWKVALEDRRLAKQFEAKLAEAGKAVSAKVERVVQGLFSSTLSSLARAALEAWLSAAVAAKLKKDHKAKLDRRREAIILRLGKGDKQTLQSVCFHCWNMFHEGCRSAKKEDELRTEHVRVTRELRKSAISRTALALSSKSGGAFDSYAFRIYLQSWRGLVLDTRAKNKVSLEAERAKAAEKRKEECLLAHMKMVMNSDSVQQMSAVFAAWKALRTEAVFQRDHQQKVNRIQDLQALYGAWRVMTVNHRRQRELDNIREEQKQLEENHKQEISRQRAKRAMLLDMGHVMSEKNQGQSDKFLLHVCMSAWKEEHGEAVRKAELEQQKADWEAEWQERERRRLEEERVRSVSLAFVLSDKADTAFEKRLLQQTVWSAWMQIVADAQREKELEGAQRLFESERRKLQEEALRADSRHHDAHTKRKTVFLMTLNDKDLTILLQTTFAAWQRCWKDEVLMAKTVTQQAMGKQITELKDALAGLEEQAKKDAAARERVAAAREAELLRQAEADRLKQALLGQGQQGQHGLPTPPRPKSWCSRMCSSMVPCGKGPKKVAPSQEVQEKGKAPLPPDGKHGTDKSPPPPQKTHEAQQSGASAYLKYFIRQKEVIVSPEGKPLTPAAALHLSKASAAAAATPSPPPRGETGSREEHAATRGDDSAAEEAQRQAAAGVGDLDTPPANPAPASAPVHPPSAPVHPASELHGEVKQPVAEEVAALEKWRRQRGMEVEADTALLSNSAAASASASAPPLGAAALPASAAVPGGSPALERGGGYAAAPDAPTPKAAAAHNDAASAAQLASSKSAAAANKAGVPSSTQEARGTSKQGATAMMVTQDPKHALPSMAAADKAAVPSSAQEARGTSKQGATAMLVTQDPKHALPSKAAAAKPAIASAPGASESKSKDAAAPSSAREAAPEASNLSVAAMVSPKAGAG